MGLTEIVAVPMARNLRSQAVMRRIGMTSDPAEGGPVVDEGPLRGIWCTGNHGTPNTGERLRRGRSCSQVHVLGQQGSGSDVWSHQGPECTGHNTDLELHRVNISSRLGTPTPSQQRPRPEVRTRTGGL
jgi:hypothetical protein